MGVIEGAEFSEGKYMAAVQAKVFYQQVLSSIEAYEQHQGRDKDRLAILERWRDKNE